MLLVSIKIVLSCSFIVAKLILFVFLSKFFTLIFS